MPRLAQFESFLRPVRRALKGGPDSFLRQVKGVIHVGANTGQEREHYRRFGLHVVWIEPIPEIFSQLRANLQGFEDQRALQALVTDSDDREYAFHVANNDGASSSILDFKYHKDVWPSVDFTRTITLRSTTLPSLLRREQIDLTKYQVLVMDTQGSELLVLLGSRPILSQFEFIKLEVSDFESYQGCCQLSDVGDFMAQHGFREFSRRRFAVRAGGGSYFDCVYRKAGVAAVTGAPALPLRRWSFPLSANNLCHRMFSLL